MKKNIIITGTSRGIGFEMVPLFAKDGHNVLALSRNESPVSGLNLKSCKAIPFDITNSDDLQQVTTYVKDNWGHVDILINNAGYLVTTPFAEISMASFQRSYEVNVFGVAALIQNILPFMKHDGHVVNISSMGGVQGSVKFPGLSAYSSSKGALCTLTEILAEEYKETGPSFNVLALGAVKTEMLEEAFPGYEPPVSALEMARYITEFAKNGQKFYNGKILQVSSSTP
ncbi:SDR family oxidoreductase [Altibacter sp.]|uniref:SDR family NAD(P)-dependent oxidoreductase n=1 Tax=Altibacter sp. TaxID=2024823 RepID=UPI000C98128F|nr:SDR family oxidoreductase [Altibacter sp.]MAP53428.1 short-chain dehydrogenase [Altibacter sp.]